MCMYFCNYIFANGVNIAFEEISRLISSAHPPFKTVEKCVKITFSGKDSTSREEAAKNLR